MKTKLTCGDVSIFYRTTPGKKSKSLYYCIKDPVAHRYSNSKKSIARLAKLVGYQGMSPKLNKADAKNIIKDAIDKGILHFPGEVIDTDPYMIDYVIDICTYQTSPWVVFESNRKNAALSKKYVDNLLSAFTLHAAPYIPKQKKLKDFTYKDAVRLQATMAKHDVSPDQNNTAIKALRTAFNFALNEGIIDASPLVTLKPFIARREEPVIFNRIEAANIIEIMKSHYSESTSKAAAYLAAKLAIYSGMRQGEIRALKWNKFHQLKNEEQELLDYYYIIVSESWDDSLHKVGPTKGRYDRKTVISANLANEILSFMKDNNIGPNDFIFGSTKKEINKPVTKNVLQDYFYEAIEEYGITEEERKKRHLTFHKLRHFYDSEMKNEAKKIKDYDEDIKKAVGHKSAAVDDNYTHDTIGSLIALGIMSKHILDLK